MGLAGRAQDARRGRCGAIVDGEQRSDRCAAVDAPQSPCTLRVPAARGHLLRWRSSTMSPHRLGPAPPRLCPHGARNAAPPNAGTGFWLWLRGYSISHVRLLLPFLLFFCRILRNRARFDFSIDICGSRAAAIGSAMITRVNLFQERCSDGMQEKGALRQG